MKRSTPKSAQAPPENPTQGKPLATWCSGILGCLLGVSLLKFGNPVILDHEVSAPDGMLELLIAPWPMNSTRSCAGQSSISSARTLYSQTCPPMVIVTVPSRKMYPSSQSPASGSYTSSAGAA